MTKYLPIIFLVILSACSSVDVEECPEDRLEGNMELNTQNDELAPFVFNGKLYYKTVFIDKKDYSEFTYQNMMGFPEVKPDLNLDFGNIDEDLTPSFLMSDQGITEIYFSAQSKAERNPDSDLYFSYRFDNEKAADPVFVSTDLNTNDEEANPVISPDGSFMIFESDRKGGQGGIDLYVTFRNGNKWGPAINLGKEINTKGDEILPFVDENFRLYYSSNGFTEFDNFDIIRSSINEEGFWKDPMIMQAPVNSKADEKGCAVFNNSLIISSNREGGCGGFDLYNLEICGDVFVHGKLTAHEDTDISGFVVLQNEKQEEINRVSVEDNHEFIFDLMPNKTYYVQYYNNCLSDFNPQQRIDTYCSDTSVVIYETSFFVPKQSAEFTFEEYDLPFFLTGYYLPVTSTNLEQIRLQFSYGILGTGATSYVEYPDEKYDEYAVQIDDALNKATNILTEKIEMMMSTCSSGAEMLVVSVTGFSDPRPMAKGTTYTGPDIDDREFGFKVVNGQDMDNDLLSKLRSYYTAKELESMIMQIPGSENVRSRINFRIEGKGEDSAVNLPNDYKRRVKISIEVIPES